MGISKDLVRVKKLVTKYKAQLVDSQMCENFGQNFVRRLENEFSEYQNGTNDVWSAIRAFDDWCMNQ
jgi:hypothetical protein